MSPTYQFLPLLLTISSKFSPSSRTTAPAGGFLPRVGDFRPVRFSFSAPAVPHVPAIAPSPVYVAVHSRSSPMPVKVTVSAAVLPAISTVSIVSPSLQRTRTRYRASPRATTRTAASRPPAVPV